MIYIEMEKKINDILSIIKSDTKIYIFGADWIGKLVLRILREKQYLCIEFLDNNENYRDKLIDGIKVLKPKVLENSNNNESIVLIASFDNERSISREVEGYGFVREINYFSLFEPLKYKMIDRLIESEKSDLFILGDSIMSIISHKDKNLKSLYSMIREKFQGDVKEFYFPACHVGIHYLVIKYLIYTRKIPNKLILPVNIANTSSYWDINSLNDNAKIFKLLYQYLNKIGCVIENTYEMEKETTREQFLEYTDSYCDNYSIANKTFDMWLHKETKTEEEYLEKNKSFSIWMHNNSLNVNHRKVIILRELLQLCYENNIKVISYLTPINYQQCERFVGPDFNMYYNKNVELIKNIFLETNPDINLQDLSCFIGSDGFVHETDTLHLNESGRLKLADKIYEISNMK